MINRCIDHALNILSRSTTQPDPLVYQAIYDTRDYTTGKLSDQELREKLYPLSKAATHVPYADLAYYVMASVFIERYAIHVLDYGGQDEPQNS